MNTWIIGYNDDNIFDMKLVIREWKDIGVGSEYRAFVGPNGNLNALCQYYNFLYFPYVARNKMEIQQKIQRFYEDELKRLFKENEQLLPCVVDFVILGQEDENKSLDEAEVKVVELNIFHDYENNVKISSGSEMFDWSKDKDVLLNGPFEFRAHDKIVEYEWYKKFVNPDWKEIMQDVMDTMERDNRRKKYIICGIITLIVVIIAIICAVLL